MLNLQPSARLDPMQLALECARAGAERGEVPVGAVIVGPNGKVLASSHNQVEAWTDSTAHAELLAIQDLCQRAGRKHLSHCDIYVSLEPCAMCAGAIAAARLRRVYFAAYDPKSGGVEHGARVFDHPQSHHRPEVLGGLRESEAAALLRAFFATRRHSESSG